MNIMECWNPSGSDLIRVVSYAYSLLLLLMLQPPRLGYCWHDVVPALSPKPIFSLKDLPTILELLKDRLNSISRHSRKPSVSLQDTRVWSIIPVRNDIQFQGRACFFLLKGVEAWLGIQDTKTHVWPMIRWGQSHLYLLRRWVLEVATFLVSRKMNGHIPRIVACGSMLGVNYVALQIAGRFGRLRAIGGIEDALSDEDIGAYFTVMRLTRRPNKQIVKGVTASSKNMPVCTVLGLVFVRSLPAARVCCAHESECQESCFE